MMIYMRNITFVVSSLFLVLSPFSVSACEPCLEVLTLQETIDEADLIVVGKKTADGPSEDPRFDSPRWIEIEIDNILKGSVSARRIKAGAWSGMCGYGIIIEDDRDYLIFMKGTEDPDMYSSVKQDCGVARFAIENGQIDTGEEKLSVGNFASRYGLEIRDVSSTAGDIGAITPTQDDSDIASRSAYIASAGNGAAADAHTPSEKDLVIYYLFGALGLAIALFLMLRRSKKI